MRGRFLLTGDPRWCRSGRQRTGPRPPVGDHPPSAPLPQGDGQRDAGERHDQVQIRNGTSRRLGGGGHEPVGKVAGRGVGDLRPGGIETAGPGDSVPTSPVVGLVGRSCRQHQPGQPGDSGRGLAPVRPSDGGRVTRPRAPRPGCSRVTPTMRAAGVAGGGGFSLPRWALRRGREGGGHHVRVGRVVAVRGCPDPIATRAAAPWVRRSSSTRSPGS